MSSIVDFYTGKNIFITGATGFMGKILIEKLLRSCPKLGAIYILIRPKKGKQPQERLQDILTSPVFDKLRETNPKVLKKLICVAGDILQRNLKLSIDDESLLRNNVNIVYHMAATVRFDQTLKAAVTLNTAGTKNLLDLICTFDKLITFMHVSTSYCHCNQVELEEQLYHAPHDPLKILELVNWMDDDLLRILTPKLIKGWPNTYAYTKCLTEELVASYGSKLPIILTRPSIVTAALAEPYPGWVDNLNGPTGLLVGAGKGVIRSMHCDASLEANIVPVDCVINSLIAITAKARSTPGDLKIFNVTSNNDNSITWGEALETGRKHFYDNPFSIALWYPGGSIKSNYWHHLFAVIFLHLIPAYLVDFLMVLTGNKPFLVRTQKRIQGGLEVLQYYTTRPWYFHNENFTTLWESLSEHDKKIFYTDRVKINFNEYILSYVLGARKYCIKEDPATLPYARKMLKRLYYLDVLKNVLLGVLLLWLFSRYARLIFSKIETVF